MILKALFPIGRQVDNEYIKCVPLKSSGADSLEYGFGQGRTILGSDRCVAFDREFELQTNIHFSYQSSLEIRYFVARISAGAMHESLNTQKPAERPARHRLGL